MKGQGEQAHPSTGSLCQYLQQPVSGQAEASMLSRVGRRSLKRPLQARSQQAEQEAEVGPPQALLLPNSCPSSA